LFDAGDVKLVILKLLAEQPNYGYRLIKTME
jgi:DNA-binding PadR family transcriptional regulator